jgi:DNA polymerase III alpha subunit
MYIFLISHNRVARYLPVSEANERSEFTDFLMAEGFPDITDNLLRVVSFRSRETRAGNKMADVIFSDGEKNLTGAMVFPQMFFKAFTMLKEGRVVDVNIEQTKDGDGYFVSGIL